MEENTNFDEKESEIDSNFQKEISSLETAMSERLTSYISYRFVRTMACVYSYLKNMDGKKAEAVLEQIGPDLKNQIVAISEKIDPKSAEVLSEVAHIFDISDFNSKVILEKTHELAQCLLESDLKEHFRTLEDKNPLLYMVIKDSLILFEDILKLDDRAVQMFLREIDSRDLAVAIINADEKIKEKIFQNMSRRAAQMLQEDSEYMERLLGDRKIKKSDEERQKICMVLKRLKNSGEIIFTV